MSQQVLLVVTLILCVLFGSEAVWKCLVSKRKPIDFVQLLRFAVFFTVGVEAAQQVFQ